MSERNPDSGQRATVNEYAYMVFSHENELLLTTTSAIAALACVNEQMREPTIVIRQGDTLRGHSAHELGWDASAEEAGGHPTYYWPTPADGNGPFLREVIT